MIEECNFKSKIRHPEAAGCNLTPNSIVCPGEDNCILYQIYKNIEMDKRITISWKGGLGYADRISNAIFYLIRLSEVNSHKKEN